MTPKKYLDYAPPAAARPRKIAGLVLLALAGACVLRLVLELDHRLTLFYKTYGGKPYQNHVDNGTFGTLYSYGAACVLLGIIAAFVTPSRHARWAAGIAAALGLAASVAFWAMHRTGALVEYDEWARVFGP